MDSTKEVAASHAVSGNSSEIEALEGGPGPNPKADLSQNLEAK